MNAAHTLAYSLVALQELNLCYKNPIIFWNTANLIVDSGSMNLKEEILIEDEDEEIENSSTDYGRIASAIGKMKSKGISFSLPDINKSDITFTPDINNNTILYGIRGITRIGNQIIKSIFSNRSYTSIEDFLSKVKVNKTQMVSLIKSGIFDNFYNGDRLLAMNTYLNLIADKKKRITLQNMQMLIEKGMIPEELDYERRLFNFNKYIKKLKDSEYYNLDTKAYNFYIQRNPEDYLEDIVINGSEASARIKISKWDNLYKKGMDPVRNWMKANQQDILDDLNNRLFNEIYDKYAKGSISHWEMESLNFYYHEHELANLNNRTYGIVDFFQLPEEPEVDRQFTTKDGSEITMFKINRIAGTVIDKDKDKSTVTLLTTTGVVTVKVWKNQFAKWDKQISARDEAGKKHILEKSFFQRGNLLIITGIRRGDNFIPKKYKNIDLPLFEKIISMENGMITENAIERLEIEDE